MIIFLICVIVQLITKQISNEKKIEVFFIIKRLSEQRTNMNDQFTDDDTIMLFIEEQHDSIELVSSFFDYICLGMIISMIFTLIYIRILYIFFSME